MRRLIRGTKQVVGRIALVVICLAAGAVTVLSGESGFVLSEQVLKGAERKYGGEAKKRLIAWQQLMVNAKIKPEREKLDMVNDFFNQLPFVSDLEHWGKEDYWATPVEMLASNGGDCEDFSIAKYFTLTAIGVPMDKLKITYVKAKNWNPVSQAHMVLTYYPTPSAIPLVLDNLIPEIKPASQRPDLIPVYSFNGSGLWLAKERGEGKSVAGGSGNIGFWRELNARMGKEFQ
jgi:predicted transglutaminase-like cysteine proteinase